jgi:hypothetical protein
MDTYVGTNGTACPCDYRGCLPFLTGNQAWVRFCA